MHSWSRKAEVCTVDDLHITASMNGTIKCPVHIYVEDGSLRVIGRTVERLGDYVMDPTLSYLISYSCFGRSDLAPRQQGELLRVSPFDPRGPGLFGNCWLLSQLSTSLDG